MCVWNSIVEGSLLVLVSQPCGTNPDGRSYYVRKNGGVQGPPERLGSCPMCKKEETSQVKIIRASGDQGTARRR